MKTHAHREKGFTLLELMIVVATVGLLASMSIPTMVRARRVSQASVMYHDMRVAASAFKLYAMENGEYPPDSGPGVMPAGMAQYLGDFPWTQKNSVNGHWNWDHDRYGFKAAVSVTQHDAELAAMQELDERVDDGDLNSGVFRARPGGYSYVLR